MHTLTQRKISLLLSLVVVALFAATPLPALAGLGGWEQIRTEDGILVSKKEVEGSPFVAFRGEGDVRAPVLSVASVLVDVPREQEWMDSVVEARILRKVSDTEYIMYSHLGTPPTMSDRDFVMDVTLTVDAAAQSVTVKMHSVDDASAPKTGYVRALLTDSVFVLTPAAGGGTHVVAEIHCDPKGSIASWIVNLFQRGWGYNTIKSLRKQVAKPGIPVPELLRAYLEGRAGSQAAN
jgi:START domain